MTGQLLVVNMLTCSESSTVEEIAEDEASLSDIVSSGDIVAVIADDDTEDYYIMKVTDEKHILKEDTDDQWGNHFVEGTSVIQGLYFERKKHLSRRTYNLIGRKRAIVHSAAVIYLLTNSKDSVIYVSENDHLAHRYGFAGMI